MSEDTADTIQKLLEDAEAALGSLVLPPIRSYEHERAAYQKAFDVMVRLRDHNEKRKETH